jgi:hypothetical protein
MKRLQRALLTSSVVFACGIAMASYTYFEGYQRTIQLEGESEQNKRLFHFGRIHLDRLELKNQHGLFIFERDKNKDWRLISPFSWPAEQDSINALADQMAAITAQVTVTEKATKKQLTEYGLDKPIISLSTTLKTGEQHTLVVGHKHNFENGYYICDEKKERIGIASSHFHDLFTRELKSFRAKQVFPYQSQVIQSVTVKKQEALLYDLTREESGWTVNQVPADSSYISRLLLILTRDLKSESFRTDKFDKANPQQLQDFGFAPPLFEVSVSIKGGQKLSAWISQDKESLNGQGPFLHLLGTQSVIGIYENFLHDIDKPWTKFRDRSISRFERNNVRKLKVVYANGKGSEIEKAEDKWIFKGEPKREAKTWKIDALLMKFSHLNSDEIIADAPSDAELARWQLVQPVHQISFFDEKGLLLGDVKVGKRQDDSHVFITSSGQTRVDVIEAQKLAGIPTSDNSLIED